MSSGSRISSAGFRGSAFVCSKTRRPYSRAQSRRSQSPFRRKIPEDGTRQTCGRIDRVRETKRGIYPPFFRFRVVRFIRVFGAAFARLHERVSVFEQLGVDGAWQRWRVGKKASFRQRRRERRARVMIAIEMRRGATETAMPFLQKDGKGGGGREGRDRREGKGGTGIAKKEKKQLLNLTWSRDLSITVFYRRRPASRTAVPRRSQNA
jgi:hypothetical protein